jgi:3-deoxy-D-manno-octulosonate 8-phosphate phosphatase (KDO 8-P phosphatase)
MSRDPTPQTRARKIKLLLFDVDGVLTDGKLFFIPRASGADADNPQLSAQGSTEFKGFHAHDGVAISLARLGGLKSGLITKRYSETVALRARDLKLEFVRQGIQDKARPSKRSSRKSGSSSTKPPSSATTWSIFLRCASADSPLP